MKYTFAALADRGFFDSKIYTNTHTRQGGNRKKKVVEDTPTHGVGETTLNYLRKVKPSNLNYERAKSSETKRKWKRGDRDRREE